MRHLYVFSLFFLIPASASAQTHRWLTLYSGTEEPQAAHVAAIEKLSDALARYGEVVSPTNASGLFEGSFSRPVQPVTSIQEAELSAALNVLDGQVGRGQRVAALRTGARIQELIDSSFEAWLTKQELAARLFHACLIVAGLRSHDDALRLLDHCRMIDPVAVPDPVLYPVEIVERLSEFDSEFRSRSTESLSIDADTPGALLLDGRSIGPVPQTTRVRIGEHRIALDTGQLSRYYRVTIASGAPVALRIDSVLDRSVRSHGPLALVYTSAEQEQENRQRHALLISRTLNITDVALVSPIDGDRLRIDYITVDGVVHCSVILSTTLRGREGRLQFVQAAEALSSRRSIDAVSTLPIERWHPPELQAAAGEAPTATTIPTPPVVDLPTPQQPVQNTAPTWSWVMGITGGALLIASVGTLAYYATISDRYSDLESTQRGFLSTQEYLLLSRGIFTTLAIGGAALLITSAPWTLPNEDGVPWWAWLSGGLGAAGLIPSIWVLASSECIDRYCLVASDGWLGASLLSYSLTFLTTPIIYWLRSHFQLNVGFTSRSNATGTDMLVWFRF